MLCYFFFFKQKTAYEVRISDWSSDVCSSDLHPRSRPASKKAPPQQEVLATITGKMLKTVRRAYWSRSRQFQSWYDALLGADPAFSSEERRVGKECVSTGRSRWST